MIQQLMETVCQNVRLGVSCPVTRAWPHKDARAPSLVFRLASYQTGADGAGEAQVEALVRAASPAQGDMLSAQAETALRNIGFRMISAEDGAEGDGGVFLRRMAFTAPLYEGAVAPLALLVNANAAGMCVFTGPFTAAQETAAAPMLPRGALSGPASLLPGRAGAGALRIRAGYLPDDPARAVIQTHFRGGTLMPCALARGAHAAEFSAYVAEFANTPLGFEALLRISDE